MLNFVPSISRLHCWYAFPPGGRPGSKETVGYFNESSSETVRTVNAVQQSVHVHGSKYNIVSHKRSGNVKFGRILPRLEKSQPRSQGLSLGRRIPPSPERPWERGWKNPKQKVTSAVYRGNSSIRNGTDYRPMSVSNHTRDQQIELSV